MNVITGNKVRQQNEKFALKDLLIALKECYLILKKSCFTVLKISVKTANLMVKPLENVIFERSITEIFFFRKYVPLVASKQYTKFQHHLLSKTAILQHP